jgi:AcrR family transcriptional regulator
MSKHETRRRIVQATRSLHEEVGPAATTISAIAQRAGVQRLTVYRHFPDDRALLAACSLDWSRDHPVPDPAGWAPIADPVRRLRTALTAHYAFFRDASPMLERVLHDEGRVPELAEVMSPWREHQREIAGGLSAGWNLDGERQRLLRAAVRHALDFHTWRSLVGKGLDDADAVELMTALVEAAAAHPRALPADGRGT